MQTLFFTNCTCIAESLYSNATFFSNATASDGYCSDQCLGIILTALLGLIVITFLALSVQLPFIHFMLRYNKTLIIVNYILPGVCLQVCCR